MGLRSRYGLWLYFRHLPRELRVWWQAAPHLLTVFYAVRGTVAMMAPFVVLLQLAMPYASVFAALGGMYTVFADAGGAYHSRMGAMTFALVGGAAALFVASSLPPMAWIAPLLLAVVAFAGGMGRAFGESGLSTGLCISIMFLSGLIVPLSMEQAAAYTGYYAIGGLWAMAFQMAWWRLRPYWEIFHEVAACYEACAELVGTLSVQIAGADPAAVRRRMRRRHKTVRAAIYAAETTLESVRFGNGNFMPVLDRAQVWLAAASREAIAAVSLRMTLWPAPGTPAARMWQDFLSAWHASLLSISEALKDRHAEACVEEVHTAFEVLEAHELLTPETRAPLRLALQHLDAAAESVTRLSGLRFGWREDLPRLATSGLRDFGSALRVQLTFRSITFRHALRVAVASGLGLWAAGTFNTSHRMWLPMTVILVLQPEFGATWKRLWERVGGTLIGVLIAGGLYFLVQGTVGEIVVIVLFCFGMFYFTRSSYGLGVVMLTPVFLLLIKVLDPGASLQLFGFRLLDTVGGGVLALLAAYLLWPLWQRGNFLPQCAVAVRSQRDYLAEAFALPGDGQLSHPALMRLRHRAERESDNVEASLRRMLAEPQRSRGDARAVFGFMTFLRRLAENGLGFAVELAGGTLSPAERRQGDELLHGLDTVADALDGKTDVTRLQTVQPLVATGTFVGAPLGRWFERLSVDVASLAVATRKLLRLERRHRIVRFGSLRGRAQRRLHQTGKQ
ncbi:MAG: FUSC family protein [Sinobacteraceae bacterium]|nr:FUSC family protein [Nevskiaceae bacterium]